MTFFDKYYSEIHHHKEMSTYGLSKLKRAIVSDYYRHCKVQSFSLKKKTLETFTYVVLENQGQFMCNPIPRKERGLTTLQSAARPSQVRSSSDQYDVCAHWPLLKAIPEGHGQAFRIKFHLKKKSKLNSRK